MVRLFAIFGRNDLRNIRRDPLLLSVLIIPWIMVLVAQLLIQDLAEWLLQQYQFDLASYYSLVLAVFFFTNIPILLGSLLGFLILDERDEKTLQALQVTPLSVKSFVFYRLCIIWFLSSLYVLVCSPLTGLMPVEQAVSIAPACLLSGLLAPVVGLLITAFAKNKVEGLAIAKGLGVLLIGPLGLYFIEPPLQYIFGLLPSYWAAKAFWLGLQGQAYRLWLLGGFIYLFLLLILLFNRFERSLRNL